jgi:hypothetical protein
MTPRLGSILLGGALLFAASAASAQPAPLPPPLAPLAFAPQPLAPSAGGPWVPAPPPAPIPEHTNRANMITGIALTGAGALMVAGGVSLMVSASSCGDEICVPAIAGFGLWVAGIPHILAGVPLAIAGGVRPDPRYRHNGARVAGIFLTSLASASLVGGIAGIAVDPTGRLTQSGGGLNLVVGISMVGVSAVEAGVGIPLWVVGAQRPRASGGLPSWAVPEVRPGLGSGSLKWTF